MRFCSLGSGSGGNATLVETTPTAAGERPTRVLLDCGFSLRELAQRLDRLGLACSDLDAVFVTHEHGDHVGCALTLSRKHSLPLWTSRGTWRAIGEPELPDGLLNFARDGDSITLGGLQLQPFTVPHDALEPLQLSFSDGQVRLGVLTDAGCATPHLVAQLQACDALLLEFNHDTELLAASPYPASLKARVGGRLGHLSNAVAAEILAACQHSGLRHVVAAHLSLQNNRPELVLHALQAACAGHSHPEFHVADAALGVPWLALR